MRYRRGEAKTEGGEADGGEGREAEGRVMGSRVVVMPPNDTVEV